MDDAALRRARAYARRRSLPLGKAVSELVERGLTAPLRTKVIGGIHVVQLPPDSPRVTAEDVRRLEDELL